MPSVNSNSFTPVINYWSHGNSAAAHSQNNNQNPEQNVVAPVSQSENNGNEAKNDVNNSSEVKSSDNEKDANKSSRKYRRRSDRFRRSHASGKKYRSNAEKATGHYKRLNSFKTSVKGDHGKFNIDASKSFESKTNTPPGLENKEANTPPGLEKKAGTEFKKFEGAQLELRAGLKKILEEMNSLSDDPSVRRRQMAAKSLETLLAGSGENKGIKDEMKEALQAVKEMMKTENSPTSAGYVKQEMIDALEKEPGVENGDNPHYSQNEEQGARVNVVA